MLGLDFTVFDFDLVSSKDDGDVFANSGKITVPVGNILVSDTRCYVKHNDGALSLNVVSITESTEFFLPGCIPNVELDWSTVSVEK